MTVVPGVEKQTLIVDDETRPESFSPRIAPDTVVPGHHHARAEECVAISGEVWIGDLKLLAGDYNVVHAGTRHVDIQYPTGATIYIRAALVEAA